MNRESKATDDNESLFSMLCAVVFLAFFLLDRQVIQPFFKSDIGKVNSLTCTRTVDSRVNCQSYQPGLFHLTSKITNFQLYAISIEERTYLESSPTYALHLVDDTTIIAIDYNTLEEAQLNYQKLNQLLTETQAFSVSLRYGNGFIRWLAIILLGHILIMGYMLFLLYFMGQVLQLGAFGLHLLRKIFSRLL